MNLDTALETIAELSLKLELNESLITDYRSQLARAKDEIARLTQLPSAIIVDGIVKQRNYK